jgi:hypothetical protein
VGSATAGSPPGSLGGHPVALGGLLVNLPEPPTLQHLHDEARIDAELLHDLFQLGDVGRVTVTR